MQYTYILTIPTLFAYAAGYTVIKYKMGWTVVPGLGSEHHHRGRDIPVLTSSASSPNTVATVALDISVGNIPLKLAFRHSMGAGDVCSCFSKCTDAI